MNIQKVTSEDLQQDISARVTHLNKMDTTHLFRCYNIFKKTDNIFEVQKQCAKGATQNFVEFLNCNFRKCP